jgi:hypothetical protein
VHGSERGTTSDDLVRELALVVVVVGLLVRVGRFTWMLSVLLLHDHNLFVILTPAEHVD